MEMPRSLAIISLGVACLLATACQTTGTPGKSPTTPKTQAAANVSTQATANTPAQTKGTLTQSQVAPERQVLPRSQTASRKGTAPSAKGVKPATSAHKKGVVGGTLENVKSLYKVITGRQIDTRMVIDAAIAAGIVVLAIGAFVALSAVRHRRLATSSPQARR
jgi:hypothetical protein